MAEQIEIIGQIERITYTNPDNGYSVLRMDVRGYTKSVTAIGYIAVPTVGELLKLKGSWKQHAKYGMQFKFIAYTTVEPTTVEGIEKYLGSGLIKGIGPVTASRIVAKFGKDTLKIIDENPDRLHEVGGVSEKIIEALKTTWSEQKELRELLVFIQSYGISANYGVRIYRQYGAMALTILQENPYRIAVDIQGIGFLTADAVAQSLGFGTESPQRAEAGVLYVLSRYVSEGNVYVPIEDLTRKTAEILNVPPEMAEKGIEQARLSRTIETEWFVNEEGNNDLAVYLPAFHYAEKNSAKLLKRLMDKPFISNYIEPDVAAEIVQSTLGIELAEKQKEALGLALKSPVMVLTGGPGTGKTTLIRAILQLRETMGERVLLAAPTGRAAKRMSEATGRAAKTIHRTLEYSPMAPGSANFKRNADNKLECDLLIIDEFSMVDQILLYHLLLAVPENASVIFVGDVDQLPSVGAGNVLRDIIDSGACPIAMLNEIFRQQKQSQIIINAHRINSGQMPVVNSYGPDAKDENDFIFIQCEDPMQINENIKELVSKIIPKKIGYNPMTEIQVLSPMHRGINGTIALNEELQNVLNTRKGLAIKYMNHVYREGDKVMQIRNNYLKDVFNGDIGIIQKIDPEESQLCVIMDSRTVTYGFDEMDELVHAYVISIHKSQGSEYPAVIIPITTQHYLMLQRNLLYTGITRGKKLVILIGTKQAISIAVRNDKTKKRWTRLAELLRAK